MNQNAQYFIQGPANHKKDDISVVIIVKKSIFVTLDPSTCEFPNFTAGYFHCIITYQAELEFKTTWSKMFLITFSLQKSSKKESLEGGESSGEQPMLPRKEVWLIINP